MAKFVYRMQNILDLKIKMEEQRKAEYGLANARLRKEEDKLRELIIRKAGYEKQARELVQGTIDVHKIHTCKHAIDAMKSAIRTQMIEVHVAEKNVELARSKLNQVMIERKTYEKLRVIQSNRSVSMTVRFHLFPFRTQKLSLLVPKIVSWKRLVKIGSRRLNKEL